MTAKCCLVTIFPLLIAAVWLASASATSTGREPKQLLFPTPFYRVQPVMESRFGPGPRQSNSPINPMIGQQGLGPFFGYFPNLLTQPCPACAACDVCPNCTVCPEVIPPPPPGNITTCGEGPDSGASASPNGTISVSVTATSSNIVCAYTLVAYYPKTNVKLTCTSLGSSTTLSVFPLVTPVTVGAVNTAYTSKANFLIFSFNNAPGNTKDLTAECVWENVPQA
ncbi:uncharacterized protein LOC124349980 [Daphnia pulicaria]|uniref:uncharacterized protein LOC124349980 n=1 Tax=Daphnia pulicaria TaxID=35523 RepID=UPI001EECB737|nr:uncharacterized protein LOC124349980 [Daphnia pulicaria]